MYILKSDSSDPYFNIALEEYLLSNYDDDFFIIAVNEPSIIVGVNQYTQEEINSLYVKKNSLKVVRRLSGGGAVFQDDGNLNFSNIYKDESSSLNDFSRVSDLISDFLNDKFNVNASFSGRNDVVIDEKKVSGQARHRFGDKILHHGTILLSSNKKSLTDALKFNPEKYADRALHSNHDRVTNLTEHLTEHVSMGIFKEMFLNFIRSRFPEAILFNLSQNDLDGINKLVKNKYSTWEWNYSSEPDYNFENCFCSKAGSIWLYLKIEDNTIKNIQIFGDFFSQRSIKDIEAALTNIQVDRESIDLVLSKFDFKCYMEGIEKQDFINCFFSKE
jgi:lipoate---protein ligase